MLATKFRPMIAIAATACAAVLGMSPTVASAAPVSPSDHHADGIKPAAVSNAEIVNAYAVVRGFYMCLDAQSDPPHNPAVNGDGVQLWTCSGGSNQHWQIPDTNTWGPIINATAGKCLDAAIDGANDPTHNGDVLQLWSCNGGTQQQWRLVPKNNGFAALCNRYAYDRGVAMCLDAATDGTSSPTNDGDRVLLWSWSGATQQTWAGLA